jgi:hypothetical protein
MEDQLAGLRREINKHVSNKRQRSGLETDSCQRKEGNDQHRANAGKGRSVQQYQKDRIPWLRWLDDCVLERSLGYRQLRGNIREAGSSHL